MDIIRTKEELQHHNQRSTEALGAGTVAEREAHQRNAERLEMWRSLTDAQQESFNDFWGA